MNEYKCCMFVKKKENKKAGSIHYIRMSAKHIDDIDTLTILENS